MITRKLYGTGAATANNVAQIIVPSSTRILAIQWIVRYNTITDGGQVDLELSLASASEIAILGAQQCVSQVSWESNFVTSGLMFGSINFWHPTDVPMRQGQILYLHALVAGTVTYTASPLIYLRT